LAPATKPRYVDINNPALSIECPNCGLRTARFLEYCRNCGYHLWPSGPAASAAFQAWRDADPSRAKARRFDLELPQPVEPPLVDFEARAHELGIHIFPSSNFPFLICLGFFFLAFAFVPLDTPVRIAAGVIGGIIFLIGIAGWVVVEDVRMYPSESPDASHEEAGPD
jgi:hypothetical protein